MRALINLIAGIGDWLVSLSDRARMQLVIIGLLLLVGGGIYKLTVSIERLQQPQSPVSPEQLIKPMEKLFEQTTDQARQYQQSRQQNKRRLDSLAYFYSDKKFSPQ